MNTLLLAVIGIALMAVSGYCIVRQLSRSAASRRSGSGRARTTPGAWAIIIGVIAACIVLNILNLPGFFR